MILGPQETFSDIGRVLNSIDRQITSSASTLIKHYHMLNIADIDYCDSFQMVEQLYHTYSKLGIVTGAIVSDLEAIRRSNSC